MSVLSRRQGGTVILVSLVLALLLSVVPLPENLRLARPEFPLLVLLYWNLALPDRVSVGTAWFVGLLQDVMIGTLLGQHALAYTVASYIAVKLHQRLRLYPLWQQAFSMMVLLALAQLLMLWIYGVMGRPVPILLYWLPTLTGTLFWPVIFLLLRSVRRGYSVS